MARADKKSGGSVAPKERINISYTPATGNVKEGVELPFKVMVVGDFTGRPDDRIMEDREPVAINRGNFDTVMEDQKLNLNFFVKNHLVDDEEDDINVDLNVKKLSDFSPDSLMENVPELKEVFELRECLQSLKGPLGNVPQMRRTIQRMIKDEGIRDRLITELGL